jgi:Fe-S cluster assembly iron-binding protein IscA
MPDGQPALAFLVTPRAAEEVAAIAAREGRPGAGLRVTVSAGGCSGLG